MILGRLCNHKFCLIVGMYQAQQLIVWLVSDICGQIHEDAVFQECLYFQKYFQESLKIYEIFSGMPPMRRHFVPGSAGIM